MLEQLQAIDPAMLLNVVRQDQRSPEFVITDWSARDLSDRGNDGGALFEFNGHGRDGQGARAWAVVLKIIPNVGEDDQPAGWSSRRRELRVTQSGLLAELPDGLTPPRCYGASERDRAAWIWMERIDDMSPARWGLEQYAFAARRLGQFNGAYAAGRPLPAYPWLAEDGAVSGDSPEGILASPHVQKCLTAQARARTLQLWMDVEHFVATRNRLPRAFCHGDMNRRNLMLRKRVANGGLNGSRQRSENTPSDQDELVAIDWAHCGVNSLGADLYALIGLSCFLCEWPPEGLAELEGATFAAYLDGLRDAGWRGDPDLVRLGYVRLTSLTFGLIGPAVLADPADEGKSAWAQHLTGRTLDDYNAGIVALCEYGLERADETRRLIDRLKLA
jgi:hypothetical protein